MASSFIGNWITRDGSPAVVKERAPNGIHWGGEVNGHFAFWDQDGKCIVPEWDLVERRGEGAGL